MVKTENWRSRSKRRKPTTRKRGLGRKTRESLERQAKAEIDEIFAEYAKELEALRGNGQSGVLYARHSSTLQDSIPAQIRSLLVKAIKLGIFISREHVFFDVAIRGSKQHREGLDAANRVIQDTQTKILLVFKTNRLYRKMYRALEYVERLIKTWKARIIFTQDNIDSASDDYEDMKLQLLAMLDEHGRRAHVDNIQSKHLDMFARMLVHGTITFGYFGEPIEGERTKLDRPRRRYVIDDFEAEYVVQIFTWFVEEGMPIAEIVQTLNADPEAPLPPKVEKEWTRLAVLTLLKNTRYIGIFKYGQKESVDEPDIDYILRREREEPLGVAMIEDLRILPDSLFFSAQELIKENKSRGGRKSRPSSKPTGSEIVRGLFECPEHKCTLWVSGKSMFCKRCNRLPRASRYLHSRLNTELAIERLLTTIGRVLCDDEELARETYNQTVVSLADFDSPDESEIEQLNDRTRKLGAKIKFAKENVGESAAEQEETKFVIAKLRTKRQKIESRIREIENVKKQPTELLDFDSWLATTKLLGEELLACRDSFDSIRLSRVRRLIQLLVGGRIPLIQCGRNSPQLGWHKACFSIQLDSALGSKTQSESDSPERVIELEFKNTNKEEQRLIAESDEAYLLDTVDKLPRNQIGELKGWSKSKVTSLLKRAYSRRGEEFVDGRGRKTQTKGWSAVFEKIGDDVVRRFAEGIDLKQIAVELGYSIDTIRNAFRHWHESRGLPVPVSQKKAKFLQDARRAYELDKAQDMKRGEIARAIGCTPSTLTRLLKKGYELNGKEFFDRRGHQIKADKAPEYQEIVFAVGPLIESGKSATEVANELGVDAATVTKAYSWYCDNHRGAA